MGDNRTGFTRRSREAKILPHKFLQQYDQSLYIDANLEVHGSLNSLFERLEAASIVFFTHPEGRPDIFEEAEVCIRLGKDKPKLLKAQIEKYKLRGFDGKAGADHAAIPAGMAILRKHNEPNVVDTMESWAEEYANGSGRDQISLAYALRTSETPFHLIDHDVRKNEWFTWRPHHTTSAIKQMNKAYEDASAVVLHTPGTETVLRRLLTRKPAELQKPQERLHRYIFGRSPAKIHFDTNILGVAPHGAPSIEILAQDLLFKKPVLLICGDPASHRAQALLAARNLSVEFGCESEVLDSPVYGTERRIGFEKAAKAFLAAHPGPTATLEQANSPSGNMRILRRWIREQRKSPMFLWGRRLS